MKNLRITSMGASVNIDGDGVSYTNIMDLYAHGDGESLQLTEETEPCRGEIMDICGRIAYEIYRLKEALEDGK